MESPTVTHLVDGKITGKEHFEQVTKDSDPEQELSWQERVIRLEQSVFPHLKPGETPKT